MNQYKKLPVFILILILFTFPAVTVSADSSSAAEVTAVNDYIPKVIRVGISDSAYFSQKQEDGSYAGIVIDYLQELSKYAGWKLDYVEGSLDELVVKLKTGEIDLMGAVLKNDYTLQDYSFAVYNSGYSYTTLAVLKENTKYVPMDYSSFHGMRVGIYSKSANRIPAFNAFVESNGLQITPVYYDDSVLFSKSLQSGEVDAILTNDTSLSPDEKILAKFGSVPYYFAVTKGNTSLLRELNSALSTIIEVNPKFDDMVYEKYFNNSSRVISLSKEEEIFLQKSSPLKVAVVSGLAPLENYDHSTGKQEGIAPDILKLISGRTGLQFEFVPVETLADAKQLLLHREVDLISGLGGTDSENGMGIVYTRQYLDSQRIMVKHSSAARNEKSTAALLNGYSDIEAEKDSQTITYDTISDCIDAVITGKADYTSFNSLVIDYYTYLRRNDLISLTPIANSTDGLSFGLAQPADPALLSILDKVIYSITTDEIQAIVYENTTANSVDVTFLSLLYTYPLAFALIAAAICFVLLLTIVLLGLFIHTRLRLMRQIALRGDSYRIISESTDEHIFAYDFDAGLLTLPETFAEQTGRRTSLPLQDIINGNDPVAKMLHSAFVNQGDAPQTTIEFECPLTDGSKAWYKAVGTVLTDAGHKPIRGIGRITGIQEEMQEKQILENRANTDSLTGLYNRQHSERRIREYFEQNQAAGHGALMVIDLDYFKKINDSLGHLAGDQVLIEFARTLTSELQAGDIIGRWGGDEFIAFLCGTADEEEISKRAGHLCRIMNREFHYEGKSHLLSISVGIAMAKHCHSYSEMFQNADQALYDVKNHKRNGFRISNPA